MEASLLAVIAEPTGRSRDPLLSGGSLALESFYLWNSGVVPILPDMLDLRDHGIASPWAFDRWFSHIEAPTAVSSLWSLWIRSSASSKG